MKRGDIYYADLNPTLGSAINKHRPVLIASNDANNRAANTVTVLPITSNIAKERIAGQPAGRLKLVKMQTVHAAIRLHLALA